MKISVICVVLAALAGSCSSQSPISKLSDDPSPAADSPDITVAFNDDYTIVDGSLQFQLKFGNIGLPMTESVNVSTKVFLIPRGDYARKLVGQGIVLATVVSPLHLATNEEVIVDVEALLPNVPLAEYYLGATTNTRFTANVDDSGNDDSFPLPPDDHEEEPIPDSGEPNPAELGIVMESRTAQLNNVTEKLLDLGEVVNVITEQNVRGKYDLYHEVSGAMINLASGTAAHSSRNILRIMEGEDEVPAYETWADTISARFLFFNLRDGTMSLGAYTSYAVDKVWYAISWNAEADRSGRDIHVDYYHNAPMVTHLDPGEYVLGVLMNVNDRFELDAYPENNLDLTYLDLQPSSVINAPSELWINLNGGSQTMALSANIHDRSDTHEWTYSIDNQPDWLAIEAHSDSYQYHVTFRPDAIATPVGLHEFNVTIRAANESQNVAITSKVFVYKTEGPILVLDGLTEGMTISQDSEGAEIVDIGEYSIFKYTFDVVNAGTLDLVYSFQNSNVTFVTPPNRRIAPGASQSVSFELPMVGLAIPRDETGLATQYIYLSVVSNGGSKSAYLTLQLPPLADDTDDVLADNN